LDAQNMTAALPKSSKKSCQTNENSHQIARARFSVAQRMSAIRKFEL
jgi:hypothetical protein